MIQIAPDPDGFYDGLYYLSPEESLEALNDPAEEWAAMEVSR